MYPALATEAVPDFDFRALRLGEGQVVSRWDLLDWVDFTVDNGPAALCTSGKYSSSMLDLGDLSSCGKADGPGRGVLGANLVGLVHQVNRLAAALHRQQRAVADAVATRRRKSGDNP